MFKVSAGRAVPQRAGSEETPRLILHTALALFRERGFDDTTLRAIPPKAGLSLGAAYSYFPSQAAIVGAYYAYTYAEHLSRLSRLRGRGLAHRLRAALHSKIDIMQGDQRLLARSSRYGGDPDHPLTWFGPASREQRRLSVLVFAKALEDERLPDDLRHAAPTLLWTLHMGVLLFFVYDASPNLRRTRALIDSSVDFVVQAKRLATFPLLRPVRRRVIAILSDAGLLPAAGAAA